MTKHIKRMNGRNYEQVGVTPTGNPIWRLLDPAADEPRVWRIRKVEGVMAAQPVIEPRAIARAVWVGRGLWPDARV